MPISDPRVRAIGQVRLTWSVIEADHEVNSERPRVVQVHAYSQAVTRLLATDIRRYVGDRCQGRVWGHCWGPIWLRSLGKSSVRPVWSLAGDCGFLCVSGVVRSVRDLVSWAGKDLYMNANAGTEIEPAVWL